MNPENKHPNFKSAYCEEHGCRPDAFERHVFYRAIPRLRLPLLPFFKGANNPRFIHDLEAIRAIGEARTSQEFVRVIEELGSMQSLDRDPVRIHLGLRISPTRLDALFAPLLSLLAPLPEVVFPTLKAPEDGTETDSPGFPRGTETTVYAMRRCLRVHNSLTRGEELMEVLKREQISRPELEDALERLAIFRAELGWLRQYLDDLDELQDFRAEYAPTPERHVPHRQRRRR